MARYVDVLPEHLRHSRVPGETCDGFDYFEVSCYSAKATLDEVGDWILGKPGYWTCAHIYDHPVYHPLGNQLFSIAITDVNTAVEFRLRWGGRRERRRENG